MAATLTDSQDELVHYSFPIEKREDTATINPVDGTPDILIWGKATDGTIDGDREIVDPDWSAKAIQEWASSKANVRMSHDPRRPVGKGQEVQVTTDGHYVKSLICDPLAKHFIRAGVLNDYSVGISEPDFRYRDSKLDPQGKALRIITGRPDGRSSIAEISICDRGSNFNSSFQIVKSAGGFTGQMVGDEDEIAKAAPSGLLTKMAHDDDLVNVDLPKGASISISPADFAKLNTLKQQLTVKSAAVAGKRDVSTAERRSLADQGDALPDGSYPIHNTGDLHNAAHLARTGHGDAEGAKRLIARRARELGVANPLDDDDSTSKGTVTDTAEKSAPYTGPVEPVQEALEKAAAERPDSVTVLPPAVKEAEPDVIKDPEPEDKPKPVKKAKKKPKKLPPWLNKPKDDDSDSDSDDSSCKGAHAWVHVGGDSPVPDIRCEKCKTTPAEAAGLSGTHDMHAAPVPDLLESPPMASTKSGPTPQSASDADEAADMDPAPSPELQDTPKPASAMMKASPEVAAILRFKHAGIDAELGRIHDLTCPAYHPEETRKCHPFADLANIDVDAFQREAVKAACGPDLGRAQSLHKAWQAAHVLKQADQAQVNDFRMAAHKAFRDANPGPTSAPTPGMISPGKYNRPLITDGHEASSTGHDGPNSSPQVATTAPDAHGFGRPPLAAGHQSPSPSHMKADWEYPHGSGQPQQLNYAVMEKDRARMALVQMHDHLGRQFPEVCPMDKPDDRPLRGVQPEGHPLPPTVGIGKSVTPEPAPAVPSAAAVFKAPAGDEEQFMDAEVYKGFKKMRKKLGKKILSGSMTVDEARAKLGRQFAQKAANMVALPLEPADPSLVPQLPVPTPLAQKSAEVTDRHIVQPLTVDMSATADLFKTAVTEALSPLAAELTSTKALLTKQQETFTTKLAEQQRVIDAIADQPDPGTAAFSGLAFNPVRKAARPAGVLTQAEIAERTQQMMIRHLQDKYNASSDPAEREAYYGTLAKMRGVSS